jgi:hypothetical protein
MNIDDETDDDGDAGTGHDCSAAVDEIDLFGAAIALCQVAQRAKTVEAALKRLRKIGRDTLVAERKRDAVIAETEQTKTALAGREAAIAAREAAFDVRTAAFESQAGDVRDELREHHARLEQTHRQLAHRLMASAGILGEWNWDLQSPPSWAQLRQRIAGLPPDPPAPGAEVVSQNVRQDWTGHNFISGSTLTRTVPS